MSRWGKVFLIALLPALLLTAAARFIYHTDREYSPWIALYGESAKRLEARCAEFKTPGICTAARNRKSMVAELQGYYDSVMAWWWPTLGAMLLAWIAVLVSLLSVARRILLRRSDEIEKPIPGKSKD